MSAMTMKDLAKAMAKIDFTMLTTRADSGQLATRPMSNNGQVEYDGDSVYFSHGDARTVGDIARDPKVGLGFQGPDYFYVAVEGDAALIRDKAQFQAHWTPDLDRWFSQGIDTPGLTMIKVQAVRIHYWNGEDEGEIEL